MNEEFSTENWFYNKLDDCIQSNTEVLNALNQVIKNMELIVMQVIILLEGSRSASKLAGDYINPKDDKKLQQALHEHVNSLNYVKNYCTTFFMGNMALISKLESGIYNDLSNNLDKYKQSLAVSISQVNTFINKIETMKKELNKYM